MTTQEAIDALKAKLAAREGKPGFEDNVAALKAKIAELEDQDGA